MKQSEARIPKTYTLGKSTIEAIERIAERTHLSYSAVIDIAIEEMIQNSISEDGAVDLPASTSRPASRTSRRIRKITEPGTSKLDNIPGVRRGLKEAA
jgi:hypothetical protein